MGILQVFTHARAHTKRQNLSNTDINVYTNEINIMHIIKSKNTNENYAVFSHILTYIVVQWQKIYAFLTETLSTLKKKYSI